MHVMTKFLIVACAILCLLLSALTVAYSANAERVIDSIKSERGLRLEAEMQQRSMQAQTGQERAELKSQVEGLQNARQQLEGQIASLQAERAELMSQKERALSAAAAKDSQIAQLSATTQTDADIIKAFREELTKLRAEQLATTRQNIELSDRINDLNSQREVLDGNVRALREQLAEVQLQMQAQASGVKAGAKGQPFDPAGLKVRGTVTDVLKSPTGDELAVIDIGSNKGLQENMRLQIVRGDQFIANLIINKAEPSQAVGTIDKLHRQVTVNKGDMIMATN